MKEKEPQSLTKEQVLIMNELLSPRVIGSLFEEDEQIYYLGYRPTDSRDEIRIKLLTPGL